MTSLINPLEHEPGAPTIGELADLLAHDLRTPLNAVRGFSELLLSGAAGPMTSEMIGLLSEIGRAGRALEEAVLCAQALGEPCITASEFTRCDLRALVVDAGFVARAWPASVAVTGEAGPWRQLLGVCRDHLSDVTGGEPLAAELGLAGGVGLELVLSGGGSGATPSSALRERLLQRLAASQHAMLVSEAPHRPVRLIARCDPLGR